MDNVNKSYYTILEVLKEKIRIARQNAVSSVNKEMLRFYWEVGNIILQKQEERGWGAKVIDKLGLDLRMEFADMKGLSTRNLKYMRAFAKAWPAFLQKSPADNQSVESQRNLIVQQAAAQLLWGHHLVILDRTNDKEEREFYTVKAVEYGWSRDMLIQYIASKLHLRQGQAITNFSQTLPPADSDMAREAFKSTYFFDFFPFHEEMKERDLEKALIQHIRKFMLELGRGFAYVGNQFNLKVDSNDYFLDLLFFNYELNRFVVYELKIGEFEPEHAGKLNFYINTINETIKRPEHNPTIGILLCKTPNKTVVKYALKGIDTPMGVADYELMKILPTTEELEQVLENEVSAIRSALIRKKADVKDFVSRLKGDEVRKAKDDTEVRCLFEKLLVPISEKMQEILNDEINLFVSKDISILIDNAFSPYHADFDLDAKMLNKGNVCLLGLIVYLKGFKPAGTKTFDLRTEFIIETGEYKYEIKIAGGKVVKEYLYHHQWCDQEVLEMAEQWGALILDDINDRLRNIA